MFHHAALFFFFLCLFCFFFCRFRGGSGFSAFYFLSQSTPPLAHMTDESRSAAAANEAYGLAFAPLPPPPFRRPDADWDPPAKSLKPLVEAPEALKDLADPRLPTEP